MRQKAQASTEYLVILAVVIIVAVVVAAMMGDFISFGSGTSEKAGKLYWKNADVGILDWIMSSDKTDSIVVRNNQEYDIEIKNITINSVKRSINETLVPGETLTLSKNWTECQEGRGYSYPVTFVFDNTEFNLTGRSFTGSEKLGGTCQ